MTAKELYEIVKDVPKDAWPKVWYDTHDERWQENWNSYLILSELAEAAFVGAMVRHQIDRGRHMPTKYEAVYSVYNGTTNLCFDTLVEALAAACKDAK